MNSRGFSGFRFIVVVCFAALSPLTSNAAEPAKSDKKSAGDDLFRDGVVARIRIEVPPEGIETLRQYRWQWGGNDDERLAVHGTIREGATVYTNVAIRLKGAAGSFRSVDQNPGLSLNFDKWAKGQRFHGLQKISLNNSVQDPSFVSDKFSRELYARAGVPVPRAGHARVEFNGRDLGLYVLTEGWNKQFLKRHFKNTKGNLYDCGFAHEITSPMHVNCGENPDDHSDLERLAAAVKQANSKKSLEPLAGILDLDRFVNFIALDAMLWNWDGYVIGHNNYRVFHNAESDKMVFMPHGMDQMFWRPDGPVMPGGKGIVARAYLGTAEGRQKYMAAVRKIMAEFFDSTALTDRVREISASLRPALQEISPAARQRQEAAADQLCRLIILRIGSLRSQLASCSNTVSLKVGQSVSITNWTMPEKGESELRLTAIDANSPASRQSAVWLEAGFYRLEGRVKTKGVVVGFAQPSGAGFRVISERKPSDGTSWDWFPYRESRNYDKRGEMMTPGGKNDRVRGDSDWTQLSYDFELHQPMADLQLFCELRASKGEAWFDPASIQLVRLPAPKKAAAEAP